MATNLKLSRSDIRNLPNFKEKSENEWSSACPSPFCDADNDGFLFWPKKGNFWCRKCELEGFVLEATQSQITPEQHEAWHRAQAERKRKQSQAEAKMLSSIAGMESVVERYHNQLAGANGYWKSCGLETGTVEDYRLGFCNNCPTYQKSSSYVIPIYQNKKLIAIKHRLVTPPKPGDKYRNHKKGMKAQLFNADHLHPQNEIPFGFLDPGEVLLVEGEVKTIYLDQCGFVVAGVPGASTWNDEWSRFFDRLSKVFVAFDPGAEKQAAKTALKLSEVVKTYLVELPAKPDDFFVVHNGTIDEFLKFVQWGRLVR